MRRKKPSKIKNEDYGTLTIYVEDTKYIIDCLKDEIPKRISWYAYGKPTKEKTK